MRAPFAQLPAGVVSAGAATPAGLWGLLGSEILASTGTGEHGPGLGQNDALEPGLRYVYMAQSYSTPGVTLYADGSHSGPVPYNGQYRLYEEGVGLAGTGVFSVAPPAAPSITQQPASLAVTEGAAATFAVVATGTAPLAYQWRRNGVAIAGANGSSYVVPVAVLADNGATFSVVVSNIVGPVTSAGAVLTVNEVVLPPSITQQPASLSVAEGGDATFTVQATGTAPLAYQWRRNGVAIAGANGSSYSMPMVVLADSGASFSVLVSNAASSAPSASALLTVTEAPTGPRITTQPADQSVVAESQVTFSVVAEGTAPLTYQWSRNGGIIAGAIGSSYSFAPTVEDDAALFSVKVGNALAEATSRSARLFVSRYVPMVAYESAMTRVLPYVNGCPVDTAVFHLQQSSTEFFQRTLAWQEWLPTASSVAGDDAYSMRVPPQSLVAKLMRYLFDGSEEDLTNARVGHSLGVNGSSVDAAWTDDRVFFLISPVPTDSGRPIRMKVALKPSLDATSIPEVYAGQYIHYIAFGAISSLLELPQFSDPSLAASFRLKFEDGVNRAKSAVARGFSGARSRSRPLFF